MRLLLTQFLAETSSSPEFKLFVEDRHHEHREFILRDLPLHPERIVNMRNRAEHPESGRPDLTRFEVPEAYRESIGIGRTGILPTFIKLLTKENTTR